MPCMHVVESGKIQKLKYFGISSSPVLNGCSHLGWEGGLFLLLYVSYTVFLILNATRHEALLGFEIIMVLFVLPLVVLTLVVTTTFEAGVLTERRRVRERQEAGQPPV